MHATFAPVLLALSLNLATALPAAAQPVDQLPMYGGLDRNSDPSLRAADEKLIADTTRHYGSREKAGAAFVGNGFAFYGRDDVANAMRRFNQAWLLDPNNPEVYFGFAVVLHDKGKNCEAATQFERAASFGRYVQGMAPDAARVMVLCAIADKSLSEEARSALFARSDALYAEALNNEPNKGYVHASMASALYWRGKYAEAWAAVKFARANGGRLPEQFLRLLQEKMPEPA
jgi:Tfp pilus assembly protein PilF